MADLSTQVVAVLSLDSTRYCFASVRLFGSTLREARLFGSTLCCSTAPLDSPCIPISICWLCLAVRVFTHTLSHAWCPVTLLSLTCCSTVVVTVAASCGRARDSVGAVGAVGAVARCVVAVARCVVAARLPPSVISSTIQCCNAVQCTGAFKRWFLCHSLVLPASSQRRSGSS